MVGQTITYVIVVQQQTNADWRWIFCIHHQVQQNKRQMS